MSGFVFLCMIFMHIVDDFYLQGKLAELKQKKWWRDNYPDKFYRNDYFVGLYLHAFSWTFLVMLPAVVWLYIKGVPLPDYYFSALFFGNVVIHECIDDMKCNRMWINLMIDQLAHLAQICITYVLLSFLVA